MNAQLLRDGGGRDDVVLESPDSAQGLERACHHLGGSRAGRGVSHFRFEQFGVGEDDTQLIVQLMEQEAEFWCIDHVAPLAHVAP